MAASDEEPEDVYDEEDFDFAEEATGSAEMPAGSSAGTGEQAHDYKRATEGATDAEEEEAAGSWEEKEAGEEGTAIGADAEDGKTASHSASAEVKAAGSEEQVDATAEVGAPASAGADVGEGDAGTAGDEETDAVDASAGKADDTSEAADEAAVTGDDQESETCHEAAGVGDEEVEIGDQAAGAADEEVETGHQAAGAAEEEVETGDQAAGAAEDEAETGDQAAGAAEEEAETGDQAAGAAEEEADIGHQAGGAAEEEADIADQAADAADEEAETGDQAAGAAEEEADIGHQAGGAAEEEAETGHQAAGAAEEEAETGDQAAGAAEEAADIADQAADAADEEAETGDQAAGAAEEEAGAADVGRQQAAGAGVVEDEGGFEESGVDAGRGIEQAEAGQEDFGTVQEAGGPQASSECEHAAVAGQDEGTQGAETTSGADAGAAKEAAGHQRGKVKEVEEYDAGDIPDLPNAPVAGTAALDQTQSEYSADEWSESTATQSAAAAAAQAIQLPTAAGTGASPGLVALAAPLPLPNQQLNHAPPEHVQQPSDGLLSQPFKSPRQEPQLQQLQRSHQQLQPPEQASMTLLQQVSRLGSGLNQSQQDIDLTAAGAQPHTSQAVTHGQANTQLSGLPLAADSQAQAPQPSSSSSSSSSQRVAGPDEAQPSTSQPQVEGSSSRAVPTVPRFLASTMVQPKAPLQEYKNATHEAVVMAYTPGTLMGIRSLPNALVPGFRDQLYHQMIARHAAERAAMRDPLQPSTAPPRLPHTLQGPEPVGLGQRSVMRTHPYAGSFATYDYLPSEFDRGRLGGKFEQLQAKLAQVTPSPFVVRGPPAGPKGAPAFSEFSYNRQPCLNMAKVQLQEDNAARAGALAGPFVTAGRAQSPAALWGRADACMMALCKQLTVDWPTSFMQVFEDKTGAIVVSFDRTNAVAEGDLSAYMQHMVKNHWLTAEYRLTKDGSHWGLIDPETQSVFFVFWPASFARHRFLGLPASQAEPQAAPTQAPEVAAKASPFPQQEGNPPMCDAAKPGATTGALSGRITLHSSPRQETGAPCKSALVATEFQNMGALSRSAANITPLCGSSKQLDSFASLTQARGSTRNSDKRPSPGLNGGIGQAPVMAGA